MAGTDPAVGPSQAVEATEPQRDPPGLHWEMKASGTLHFAPMDTYILMILGELGGVLQGICTGKAAGKAGPRRHTTPVVPNYPAEVKITVRKNRKEISRGFVFV